MPINIDVFDFKCFNELKNGPNFDRNLSDFTPNLVGNVGEKVRVSYTFNISQTSFTEGAEEWEIVPSQGEIRRQTGSFLSDAIQVGDRYIFYPDWLNQKNGSGTAEYNGIVTFVSSDGKILKYTVASGTDSTTGTQTNVGLVFDQKIPENVNTAMYVRFGLIGNEETFNYTSKTTEGLQVYYAGGLIEGFVTLGQSLGKIKDWVSGGLSVLFTSNTPTPLGAQYEIRHDFIINPFYILAYREFIDNGTIPELFSGDESIKYAAELELRKTLTNTGSAKIASFDNLNGFVGWYGENFNGLNKDYEVVSVAYEDAGTTDPLEGVNINASTKATIVVNKISGSISTTACGVYIIKLPTSEDEYIGTETNLLDNFIYKSGIVSPPDTSAVNVGTSIISGDLVIEYTIDYTVAERLKLSTDDEYLLLVQIEDPSLQSGNSDRIMLIADLRNYTDVDFLSDFINIEKYNFVTHGKNTTQGKSSTIVANEDGVLLDAVIGANTLRDVIINSISAQLVAYNETENNFFNLDTYSFSIGGTVISGGLQQIEVDTSRGYPLPEGDIFNLVKIETLSQVGDNQRFSVQIGQKIKWQDWIPNPSVDDVFFNSLLPNNNLNYKSSNYSEKQDYKIKLALVIGVSGLDDLGRTITGDFVAFGGDLEVRDYDQTDQFGLAGVIETFDPVSGQSLGGGILFNGADTLFRCTFENADGITFGIHRIEPSQSQGDGILELSSTLPSVGNNILKPLEGETLLKFTRNGSQVVTECLISGDLVQEGINYKLSARAGNLF